MSNAVSTQTPEPEVTQRPVRRRFSPAYKRRILEEVDQVQMGGQVAALLRREGIYSSYLTKWREERALLAAGGGPTRGTRGAAAPAQAEVEGLRREVTRLKRRLEKAEKIIEIQKKISEILGIETTESLDPEK